MKLLLAEDTKDLNRVVSQMLTMQGYDVDSAYDGEQALALALENGYDGMILDIMMPKKSGLEVLTKLREKRIVTPVLMLTAKAEVDDRVAGLDAGADDYLTKPFAMKELLARVRAMTRRGSDYSESALSFGDLNLNAKTLEVSCANTVRLSMKEFELLRTLILNREHPLDSSYLSGHVWSGEDGAGEDTVWLYIRFLCNKLGYIGSGVTIRGSQGGPYRIEAGDGETA